MSTERKYALIKVEPGDYVLPSNDSRTIWRISRYSTGSTIGWGLWSWNMPVGVGDSIDTADWSRWEFIEGPHATRAGAISRALEITV